MKEDIQNHDKQIFKTIVSAMKIKSYDLCFCGSGKKYKNCCDKKMGNQSFLQKRHLKMYSNIKNLKEIKFKRFHKDYLNNFRNHR